MLQIIDDDNEQGPDTRPDLFPIELLLDYFIHETSCGNNFEFIQAVIRLFLKVWISLYFFYATVTSQLSQLMLSFLLECLRRGEIFMLSFRN